jgi:ubiquinone biosynthesis accessory factor UbiJ
LSGERPAGAQATFGWPFSFALNHLLDSEPWARERLAPFAGEAVELRSPPLPALRFTILPGGRVEAGGGEPALVVTLGAGALAAAARGEEHFMRSVEVTGNARLANEVMLLVRHLRWDAEEDLSRLVGDVAAHRIAQAGRSLVAWQADTLARLAETFADYAAQERRLLVRRAEHDAFTASVARLRDAVERLEKRIGRLG